MNHWELVAAIGVPSLITLIGMAQNMDATGQSRPLQSEVNNMRNDLQVFFRDLVRHEEAIGNLTSKL